MTTPVTTNPDNAHSGSHYGTTIIRGIVGSTAYGLAGPDSDIDRLGVFVAPSEAFWGLNPPEQSHVTNNPDVQMHEVGKMVSLLLKVNPTVSELLWLPGELYEVRSIEGAELIAMRGKFLSAPYVRNAYFGYATQQFRKLSERGNFSSALGKRTEKHARHLLRLLHQGYQLYSTGHLSVKLDDPDRYHEFGRQVAADHSVGAAMIASYEYKFDNTTTPLPNKADVATVEEWLIETRRRFLV